MAWYWWVLLGVGFVVVEITTLDLIFLMLAVGALAGAAETMLASTFLAQALVACAVALLMLVAVRPIALRHLQTPGELRSGTNALPGTQARVLERVDSLDGRVKIGGETWSARSADPSQVIEPGTTVDVVRIDGATAIVNPSVNASEQ